MWRKISGLRLARERLSAKEGSMQIFDPKKEKDREEFKKIMSQIKDDGIRSRLENAFYNEENIVWL